MPQPIISRKSAVAAGLNSYYTGTPCKNGHLAKRYTSSGTCADCIKSQKPEPKVSEDPEKIQRALEAQAAQKTKLDELAAKRESDQRAREHAKFFTDVIIIMDDKLWPNHLTRVLELVQMNYPDITYDHIVPKQPRTGEQNGFGRFKIKLPPELIELQRTMEHGLLQMVIDGIHNKNKDSEPGAMFKKDFMLARIDETGKDMQFGYVVRIGDHWYDKEVKWGPDPLVHPIYYGFMPRKNYHLYRVHVLHLAEWDGHAYNDPMYDETGEWMMIDGDWYKRSDVDECVAGMRQKIESYMVKPQLKKEY